MEVKEEVPVEDESVNKKESINALKSIAIERRYEFEPINFTKADPKAKPEKIPESVMYSFYF